MIDLSLREMNNEFNVFDGRNQNKVAVFHSFILRLEIRQMLYDFYGLQYLKAFQSSLEIRLILAILQ